jgi:hypothetical protein
MESGIPVAGAWGLVCILGLVGCLGTEVGSAGTPLNLETGPGREQALCASYVASVAHPTLCLQYADSYANALLTEEALAWACRPGTPGRIWAQSLLAAVSDGRVAVDWSAAESCLSQSRALRLSGSPLTLATSRNDEWQAVRDGPCASFYRGLKGEGEACEESWDCEGELGCFSIAPFVAGSLTCLPLGRVGEPCSSQWRPCSEGLSCDSDTDRCYALKGNGQSCSSSSECASGNCQTVCQPLVTRALGQSCSSTSPCDPALACTTCRAVPPSSTTTCQPRGALDAPCNGTADCAEDLSCLAGRCRTLADGASCQMNNADSRCGPGRACVPTVACEQYASEYACSDSQDCTWQSNGCVATRGRCGVPASVPPLPACEVTEDCEPGEYCDTSDGGAVCRPYRPTDCRTDDECPPASYCALCDTMTTAAACTAHGGCAWDFTQGSCAAACAGLDAYDCSYNAGCRWDAYADECVSTDSVSSACAAKLPVGTACRNNSQCESEYCTADPAEVHRCAQPVQGCAGDEQSGLFLQTVLLFGLVLVRGRRKDPKGLLRRVAVALGLLVTLGLFAACSTDADPNSGAYFPADAGCTADQEGTQVCLSNVVRECSGGFWWVAGTCTGSTPRCVRTSGTTAACAVELAATCGAAAEGTSRCNGFAVEVCTAGSWYPEEDCLTAGCVENGSRAACADVGFVCPRASGTYTLCREDEVVTCNGPVQVEALDCTNLTGEDPSHGTCYAAGTSADAECVLGSGDVCAFTDSSGELFTVACGRSGVPATDMGCDLDAGCTSGVGTCNPSSFYGPTCAGRYLLVDCLLAGSRYQPLSLDCQSPSNGAGACVTDHCVHTTEGGACLPGLVDCGTGLSCEGATASSWGHCALSTSPDPDPDPDPDPSDCVGTASSVMPAAASYAEAYPSSGRIGLLLTPRPWAELQAGDQCTLLELSPTPGQLSYPPGAGARCGIIAWSGSTWLPVQEVIGCEMSLSVLTYASSPDVCDGQIAGTFDGLLSGNAVAAGAFFAPLPVAESQIVAPSCRPSGAACSSHDQCCSESCSIYIGVCN